MAQSISAQGLVVKDGTLLRNGHPYRGIGVNYYNAFNRTLQRAEDSSYEAGFKVLRAKGIPFVRFAACGYWPAEMRLYQTNKTEYFKRLDGMVRSAETNGIGLIPSLFWYLPTIPDLVGETCNQWGNPKSKTHEFLRTYTREIVTRYKDSTAIWGWEFGNEFNLAADLPNAADNRPPVIPSLGTAEKRSADDDMSGAIVQTALQAFADEVRRYDSHRLLITGHAIPRASAWHLAHEKNWKKDSTDEFAIALKDENAAPFDVLSIHVYAEDIGRIGSSAKAAARIGKPLFVGEFGIPGEPTPEARRSFNELLNALEEANTPLAALWVFDFPEQPDYSIFPNSPRSYQLEAIAEANRRLATQH